MGGRTRALAAGMLIALLSTGWLTTATAQDDPPLLPPLVEQPTPAPEEPEPAPEEPAPAEAPPADPGPPSSGDAGRIEAAVRAVSGMGMYIWRWERTGGVDHVVAQAQQSGISHLIVRASSQSEGFYLEPILAELLPKAHAANIKVVAYDPPRFEDIEADVARAAVLASFRVDGHGIDAFAADIEPKWELTNPQTADHYGLRLREVLGEEVPMIGIIYPPNQVSEARYPYTEIARHFDVLSPMSYWRAMTLDGPGFTATSVEMSQGYGKPVSVIGQAFSYHDHRNPVLQGHPPVEEFEASIAAARSAGSVGMSFWVWEHAEPWVFDSIARAEWPGDPEPGFGWPPPPPPPPSPEPSPTPVADVDDQELHSAQVAIGDRALPEHNDRFPWLLRALAAALLAVAVVLGDGTPRMRLVSPRGVAGALMETGAWAGVRLRVSSLRGSGRSDRA